MQSQAWPPWPLPQQPVKKTLSQNDEPLCTDDRERQIKSLANLIASGESTPLLHELILFLDVSTAFTNKLKRRLPF